MIIKFRFNYKSNKPTKYSYNKKKKKGTSEENVKTAAMILKCKKHNIHKNRAKLHT